MEHVMDDYQETRLYEPDDPPEVQKTLKRRRLLSWALYGLVAVTLLVALVTGTFRLW
jgi:hypothetical protein